MIKNNFPSILRIFTSKILKKIETFSGFLMSFIKFLKFDVKTLINSDYIILKLNWKFFWWADYYEIIMIFDSKFLN